MDYNNSQNWTLCDRPLPISIPRFVIIVLLGTPLALIGVVTNSIILYYFARPRRRRTPTLYLAVLAFLDISICSCYLLIMSADAVAIFWNIEFLWVAWHHCLVPVYTFSRIVQLSSSYVIVFASLERWILVSRCNFLQWLTSNSARRSIIMSLLFSAVSLRLITIWEYVVEVLPNCVESMTWLVIGQPLAGNRLFQTFDLYVLPTLQVFVPFAALLLLNMLTIYELRNKHIQQEGKRKSVAVQLVSHAAEEVKTETDESQIVHVALDLIGYMFEIKKSHQRERSGEQMRMRAAAVTSTALVSTYLVCNSYSLFIRTLERILPETDSLIWHEPYYPTDFYTISSDVISFLFMFNSFIRLLVYYLCNMDIRRDLLYSNGLSSDWTSDAELIPPPFS